MSRLISTGNVNADINVGRNGEEFLLCFRTGGPEIEKDTLIAPVANKRCVVKVNDVKETESEVIAKVVFLDADERAWVPEEYLSENEYWVKLGKIKSWEPESTFGSIQFAE